MTADPEVPARGNVAVAVLEHLSPRTLRDLAAALEARTPAVRARGTLPAEGVAELADILISGTAPTIGFYRRYLAERPAPAARPLDAPAAAPAPEVQPAAPVIERTDVGPALEIGGVW
jgi:hypothetical protein